MRGMILPTGGRAAGLRTLRTVGPIAIAGIMSLFGQARAQTLQITSPANGAVVPIGQTLTVTVQATGVFQSVIVFSQDPLPDSTVLASPPYQFTIVVPSGIPPGSYALTASGAIAPGQTVDSAPIVIDVEDPSQLVSLRADLTNIAFQFVGQQIPVLVTGTFSGGIRGDISRSSKTTYSSTNTSVAVVNNTGLATAAGPGTANIVVEYSGVSLAVIAVSVPSAVRGDLNGDGKVNQDDLNVILSALNTPATKPVDARDLNGDGVINALDSRILVTLCSLPGCANR